MSILYRILAAVGIAAILFCAGYYYGHSNAVASIEADYAKKFAASLEQSRATERARQEVFDKTARHLTNEINSISTHRDSLIARLRQRESSGSVPQGSGTDCPRPDWRTIPAEMGAEVILEVSERDTYREGLIACYQAMDSLR